MTPAISRAELITAAVAAIDGLRDFWPLTLRQVHYRLVASGATENSRNAYKRLSVTLVAAREAGQVPWEAIEDRSRKELCPPAWANPSHFVDAERDAILAGYRRDLFQSQGCVPEVWIEKDALAHVCNAVTSELGVRLVIGRGFVSRSFLRRLAGRVRERAERGQRTVVLQFGDLDPSGEAIPVALAGTLRKWGLGDAAPVVRCALTLEQVEAFGLPPQPGALKHSDSRAAEFIRRNGLVSVELDALEPADLQGLIRGAIEHWIDADALAREQAQEEEDRRTLEALRGRALEALAGAA